MGLIEDLGGIIRGIISIFCVTAKALTSIFGIFGDVLGWRRRGPNGRGEGGSWGRAARSAVSSSSGVWDLLHRAAIN